ncbi:MAG TPA: Lrp/AsnC ligand binding domain-containing protein [Thermoplasmata archaeon]|nr:Lrp/AsnC ligand binding domain-containing protein [Thermoplasmata archaeon]
MSDEPGPELTLYVRSKKVVTSFYRPPPPSGGGSSAPEIGMAGDHGAARSEGNEAGSASAEEFFLSDDQARCVALAEELAAKRGYQVKVLDVARAGPIERLFADRLKGVERFPVLVGPGNARLEGAEAFTEEHLSEMMPAEMQAVRAFTYLKVRGGDLERIRTHLLGFPEVRELHLLTGDWDIFVVLEFRDPGQKKRQVLDFVTERIRRIPEVLDTSTLVPEDSVSKFPF